MAGERPEGAAGEPARKTYNKLTTTPSNKLTTTPSRRTNV